MGVAREARGDKHLPLVMMNSISALPLMDEAAPTCQLLSESQFGKWMVVVRQPPSHRCFSTSLDAHKLCACSELLGEIPTRQDYYFFPPCGNMF